MTSLVAGSTQTTSYSYDNANLLTSTTLPDGSVETRSYTAAADLASIESVKSGTTITSSTYSYDSLGRKTGETTPSYALAYTYDNGGQLTGEVRTGASAYSVSYTYDNAGNRATKTLGGTTENYSYDDANKLLTAGGKSYSYDGSGNMTGVSWSGGSTSLTWNGAGYLKSASNGSTTVNYAYNGLGQRVGKSGGASASYILSDDSIDSQVLNDGAASFVHGASGLVSENRGGTSKFYHADALGSVKALTDGSGSVTDSRNTDAFGLVVTTSGSTPTPFGFAGNHGYQQDDETGLMRLGHRMYDASTGRFISRDPIQDGYNWYAYCENDPLNAIGPEGLDTLVFNGEKLKWYDDSGKLTDWWPGVSGFPGSGKDNQNRKDRGPIPEGKYEIRPAEDMYYSENPLMKWSPWNYDGGRDAWGDRRIPIHPLPGTDTHGRGNMYIHGGDNMGSAGCIDVGNNDISVVDKIEKQPKPVKLVVDYGGWKGKVPGTKTKPVQWPKRK
jgi:RHS repeat-associated protein